MTTTKSWEGFCGSNFIKVDDVEGEEDAFVVVSIEIYGDQGSSKPRLSLEKNKGKFTFDLNVTNSNFCKNPATEHHHNTKPIGIHKFNYICHSCHIDKNMEMK